MLMDHFNPDRNNTGYKFEGVDRCSVAKVWWDFPAPGFTGDNVVAA